MKNLRIIIDGDSCPVVRIIQKIATEYKIDVILFCSYCHVPKENLNMETVVVDAEPQAVDMAIVNRIIQGDVVVTQDYGLASIVLSKKAKAISPTGKIYTEGNIDQLLYNRYLGQKIRKSGGRLKGPQKRSEEDDIRFEKNLIRLIIGD
jgi:uncharacterized protein YaiI (UPF0178 family)